MAEVAVKQHIVVDVALGILFPRDPPMVVHKLLLHLKRRRYGSRGVAFMQVFVVDDFTQGRGVMLVKNHRLDFCDRVNIPIVAAHIDILG